MSFCDKFFFSLFLWGVAGGFFSTAEALLGPAYKNQRSCQVHIKEAEEYYGIPRHLLQAIALGESGRTWEKGKAPVAWPWTINAQGQGKFFPSKAAAIAEVRRLQAQGVKSIDVGCMQVNLHHHPDAFGSLEEAFDPRANVRYAAEFILSLKRQVSTWTQAVAHYHSATEKFHKPYRERIMKIWQSVQRFGLNDGEDDAFLSFPLEQNTISARGRAFFKMPLHRPKMFALRGMRSPQGFFVHQAAQNPTNSSDGAQTKPPLGRGLVATAKQVSAVEQGRGRGVEVMSSAAQPQLPRVATRREARFFPLYGHRMARPSPSQDGRGLRTREVPMNKRFFSLR